ncbi:MAG: SMI1/KNR4 family protein [Vulcanimicrobiota bacterium]
MSSLTDALKKRLLDEWPEMVVFDPRKRATDNDILEFEKQHESIPDDVKWFFKNLVSGGVDPYISDIHELAKDRAKFLKEKADGLWELDNIFLLGVDGAGNPFGISRDDERVLLEDHDFGGIQEIGATFADFLQSQLDEEDDF